MTTQHTPTPWFTTIDNKYKEVWIVSSQQYETKEDGGEGCQIAEMQQVYFDINESYKIKEANAAFIVRACNSHDELLNALELARDELQLISDENGGSHGKTLDKILSTISKAQGE